MKKTISNEQMNLLPLKQFEGEIIVVEDHSVVYELVNTLKHEDVLGFDTETKPSFKKGAVNQVSLIQLSTFDKAYLFRLNNIGFHQAIIDLLKDESVLKVGVAIKDDLRHLRKIKTFLPGGFIELQTLATSLGYKDTSLKKLAALFMNIRIPKRQRLSNWEAKELSQGQLTYAATDAWAALEIYNKICIMEPSVVPEPIEL